MAASLRNPDAPTEVLLRGVLATGTETFIVCRACAESRELANRIVETATPTRTVDDCEHCGAPLHDD